jgi:hypothetical protein
MVVGAGELVLHLTIICIWDPQARFNIVDDSWFRRQVREAAALW